MHGCIGSTGWYEASMGFRFRSIFESTDMASLSAKGAFYQTGLLCGGLLYGWLLWGGIFQYTP